MDPNDKKIFFTNIKWLVISKIVVYILSIITITLIPRYLGVEAYGQLNFAISFVALFAIIGDLGITTLVYRDVSKNPKLADKYFNNLFIFRIILSIIMGLIIGSIILFMNKSHIVNILLIIAIFYEITLIFSSLFTIILSALQKMKYIGISEILAKLIYTISILLIIFFNFGVLGVMLSYLFSVSVGFIFLWIILKKYIQIKLRFNWKYIRNTLYRALPFAIIIITSSIYFNIDRLYISLIHGDYQVGLYAISYTFYMLLISITSILYVVFFPIISNYINNKLKFTDLSNKFIKLIFIISVPICIGSIYLSKKIIALVFGYKYVPGFIAFDIILVFFLFSAINQFHSSLLQINNKEHFYYKLLIAASASNILLNFIVIPYFGIIGAAITTLISELIICIGASILIRRKIVVVNYLKELFGPLISCIVMVIGLVLFDLIYPTGLFHNKFDVLINVGVGAIIYCVMLLLIRSLSFKEIRDIILNRK